VLTSVPVFFPFFGIFLTPVFYSVIRRFSGPESAGPETGVHVAGLSEPEPEPDEAVLDGSAGKPTR
jgi:hypothetical protein